MTVRKILSGYRWVSNYKPNSACSCKFEAVGKSIEEAKRVLGLKKAPEFIELKVGENSDTFMYKTSGMQPFIPVKDKKTLNYFGFILQTAKPINDLTEESMKYWAKKDELIDKIDEYAVKVLSRFKKKAFNYQSQAS